MKDEAVAAVRTSHKKGKGGANNAKGLSLPRVRISVSIHTVLHSVGKAVKAEHAVEGKAAELKHDAAAAAHVAGEKVTETAHQAQGTNSSIASMPPLTNMFSRESGRINA